MAVMWKREVGVEVVRMGRVLVVRVWQRRSPQNGPAPLPTRSDGSGRVLVVAVVVTAVSLVEMVVVVVITIIVMMRWMYEMTWVR